MSMHFYSTVKSVVPYADTDGALGKQFHAALAFRFMGSQKTVQKFNLMM